MPYIYLASTPQWITQNIGKIGCTDEPYGRIQQYLTGCPPCMSPSCDIEFFQIWKLEDDADKYYYENYIHEWFKLFRMRRKIDGDSEWFNFKNESILENLNSFMKTREWVVGLVSFNNIEKPKRTILQTYNYNKNTLNFEVRTKVHNEKLDAIQKPIINKLNEFIKSDESAGYLIAPCGSGKTRMTCSTIEQSKVKKVIICVPSLKIQSQWKNTLSMNLTLLGGSHYDEKEIKRIILQDTYCIVSTYASSKYLIDVLNVDLVIFDEAHHMSGIVASKDEGIGSTRLFLDYLVQTKKKRLFLTYTPKLIQKDEEDSGKVFSMNDETVFGKCIYQVKLRDLIKEGILPDYNIWLSKSEGSGITAKVEQCYELFNSKQINGQFILKKLLVFTETIIERNYAYEQLKKTIPNVFRITDKDVDKPIRDFEQSDRAILVDCMRLGEGVDIPCADSVAVLYPKHSIVSIVQTLLRPGRWFPYKSVFHMIICNTLDDNTTGFEDALVALSSHDEDLRREIMMYTSKSNSSNDEILEEGETSNGRIHIERLELKDSKSISTMFNRVRTLIIPKQDLRAIRKECISRGIRTSFEYQKLRDEITHFPEDPRFSGLSWFDFLNPNSNKIEYKDFKDRCIYENIYTFTSYSEWLEKPNEFPSYQNLEDGYFQESQILPERPVIRGRR